LNGSEIKTRLTVNMDQCVKCGLCLPHCPTYRIMRDEAESPRGRIALIQGSVDKRIPDSPSLQRHLGNCLECRVCETVCPSLVRFGEIMDDARALSALRRKRLGRQWHRIWIDAISGRFGTHLAPRLATLYRLAGLARLVEWIGLARWPTAAAIHRLAVQLQPPPAGSPQRMPAASSDKKLTLFLGCVVRTAQPGAIDAAILVLQRLGFAVEIPQDQGCCGAMHRHNGLPEQADRLLAVNARVFRNKTAVGIASACVAELRSHTDLAGTKDICRLLADLDWPKHRSPNPLPYRVAVHEPCSQRNMLRDGSAAYDLLRHIPDIKLLPLPDNAFCCGAAGTYLLQRPQMAGALLQPKLDALARLNPKYLVTTNTGCALHLAAGIRAAGLAIELLHPVELIARQLGEKPESPL